MAPRWQPHPAGRSRCSPTCRHHGSAAAAAPLWQGGRRRHGLCAPRAAACACHALHSCRFGLLQDFFQAAPAPSMQDGSACCCPPLQALLSAAPTESPSERAPLVEPLLAGGGVKVLGQLCPARLRLRLHICSRKATQQQDRHALFFPCRPTAGLRRSRGWPGPRSPGAAVLAARRCSAAPGPAAAAACCCGCRPSSAAAPRRVLRLPRALPPLTSRWPAPPAGARSCARPARRVMLLRGRKKRGRKRAACEVLSSAWEKSTMYLAPLLILHGPPRQPRPGQAAVGFRPLQSIGRSAACTLAERGEVC